MKTYFRKFLSFTLVNLLFVFMVKAQIFGYGSGFTADPAPMSSFVLNSIRAKVSSINYLSPPYSLTYIPEIGMGAFTVGDMILIAQVKGGTEGTFQNLKVIGVSGNSLTIEPVPGMTFIYGYSTGGTDQVQIVRIPVYDNFTLMQDMVVSCAPYNPTKGHGGIMAMVVKGSLILDGGIITANGAGYDAEGISWGNGGYPAAGRTINDHFGYEGETIGKYFDGSTCQSIQLSSPGENGGSANNGALYGDRTIGSLIIHNPSNYPNRLLMGNAGGYKPGSGGGQGSGSGGPGGKGGDVQGFGNAGLGQPGDPGGLGNKGGNAGQGQPGGGAIVIKCHDIEATNPVLSLPLISISANGADGGFGSNGGDGGTGGKGGKGGKGGCISNVLVPDGGDGGDGVWGAPGEGGDGGNGGNAGYIWIGTQNSKLTYNQLSSLTSLKGGARGLPGAQGYYEIEPTTAQHDQKVMNHCLNDALCPPPPCNPTSELRCDKDKVMCTLFNAFRGNYGTVPGEIIFKDVSGTQLLKYTPSDGRLVTLVPDLINCVNYYYFLHFNVAGGFGNATDFMIYLARLKAQPTTNLIVDLGQTYTVDGCDKEMTFNLINHTTGFVYNGANNTLYDVNQNKFALILPCPGKIISGGQHSYIGYNYAKWGDPGTDGDKQNQINSNLVLDVPCPFKTKLNNDQNGSESIDVADQINFSYAPNSGIIMSTNVITIQNLKYCIYDMSGRLILNGSVTLEAGINSIHVPIENFQHGIFIMDMEFENGHKSIQKIVN